MSFDLRPHLHLDSWYWQVNQKLRSDANWNENCVPTSFALCCLAYGINPGDPQAWTNYEYGSSYHGPEGFGAALDYIQRHFPSAPAIASSDPSAGSLPAALDAAGRAGQAMVAAWYCDCATVTIGAGTDCGHASLPVAFDGTNWTLVNVWDGRQQVFSTADLERVYMGGLAVFKRSLIPAPQEDVMPLEIPFPPTVFPAGSGAGIELAHNVNTHVIRAWVWLRSTSSEPASGTFYMGDPSTGGATAGKQLTAPGGGQAVQWQLPDNAYGHLVFIPAPGTGSGAVSYKVGTKAGAPTAE